MKNTELVIKSYGAAEEDPAREKNLFKTLLLLAQLTGLNPQPRLPAGLPSWLRVLLQSLACLHSLLVIVTALQFGVLFCKTTLAILPSGELQDITDALTIMVIYSFATYASAYWCVRAKRLQRHFDYINAEYRHHSLAGVCFVNSAYASQWTRSFSTIWFICCMVGVLYWGLTPLLLGAHTLPLFCWYPFDAMAAIAYPWVYATQLFGQVIVGSSFAFGGNLYVTLCLLLLAQFDVLYCSLKNLDAHARLRSGATLQTLRTLQRQLLLSDASCELNQYAMLQEHATELQLLRRQQAQLPSTQLSDAARAALVDCVRHHRFILSCAEELEALFSPYCLVKSMQITMQLCLLVFVGVSGSREVSRIINQLQYLCLTLCELFMFTYCGELLRRHSLRAGEALWRGAWWQHAPHLRQDMLIFLLNSRRPVQVTAGKFYAMDVGRLRGVSGAKFPFHSSSG
ncbi:Or85e [Drosophila busckii]|uniref:Odorant receptor n=1 Tax=Drosophila busckii TaxID=30019 RepID=A0A0M4EK02_DROBS|nr:Or85e [Drosophila busckii]